MSKKFQLDWTRLLSSGRVIVCDEKDVRLYHQDTGLVRAGSVDTRSPFERDYCTAIYSGAFRRLSGKTQIAPLPQNDYVRFRLTHSLEVSSVAGSLWRKIEPQLMMRYGIRIGQARDVEWILRTAGLVHDIGNPPFGHSGERAIQAICERFVRPFGHFRLQEDLKYFDGNAESFRILSRNDLKGSLEHRMTAAVLGTIIKYPNPSRGLDSKHPKYCTFDIDLNVFDAVMVELGLKRPNGTYARHPLSFLLEAADDICYMFSDFEDAIKLDMISEDEVCSCHLKLLGGEFLRQLDKISSATIKKNAVKLRSLWVEKLLDDYSRVFCDSYDELMQGKIKNETDFKQRLNDDVKAWIKQAKKLKQQIFSNSKIKKAEKKGDSALKVILEKSLREIEQVERGKRPSGFLKNMLGSDNYNDYSYERKVHAVLDYIVGMTDVYLLELAKKKTGKKRTRR